VAGAAQATTPDPDPNDPTTAALRATALLVQPTWEVKGKWFTCWTPSSKKRVQLPIEPKPGPYTPTEVIHPVLGQPEMLFAICVAIAEEEHSLLEGPTGTAKTTLYRWLAQELNWNLVTMPCSRDTEESHMIGEYLPHESKGGAVSFKWTWGPISTGAIASQTHPTLLVFEELNRIGSQAALARLYSLLDDTRELEVYGKRGDKGVSEKITPGRLFIGATQNPAESGHGADYIGVQELDPALRRRFQKQRQLGYPPEPIEAEALRRRVSGLSYGDATRMVKVATAVRMSEETRFPMSFPDMVSWATGLPYYGWEAAAEVAVVSKAHPDDKVGIRNLVELKPTAMP
jgi:MoxR-like ATPase